MQPLNVELRAGALYIALVNDCLWTASEVGIEPKQEDGHSGCVPAFQSCSHVS
jgi:hypothetical protein